MIVGLGVDLARASRFTKLLAQEKRGVITRVFTPDERAYALGMKDPAPHLAAKRAARWGAGSFIPRAYARSSGVKTRVITPRFSCASNLVKRLARARSTPRPTII